MEDLCSWGMKKGTPAWAIGYKKFFSCENDWWEQRLFVSVVRTPDKPGAGEIGAGLMGGGTAPPDGLIFDLGGAIVRRWKATVVCPQRPLSLQQSSGGRGAV